MDEISRKLSGVPGVSVEVLGYLFDGLQRLPQVVVTACAGRPDDKPWLLLSGGVHGDEPAGVAVVHHFVRDFLPKYSQAVNFVLLPCVNPTGFVAGTANTCSGVNLNRSFVEEGAAEEVRQITDWMAANPRRYRMTFDLHEIPPMWEDEGFQAADNPNGCYLYETQRDKSLRVGGGMIDAVSTHVAVCDWPTIYDDVNQGGVVWYPEANRNAVYAEKTSLDSFLQLNYTDHSFTTETPTTWPLRERIATHLTWLVTAINSLL